MDIRQTIVGSPLRIIGVAIVVILLFALLFPFVGGFQEIIGRDRITYTIQMSDLPESEYSFFVLERSLHLSVRTFTLAGSAQLTPVGDAQYLADLEALLGMGLLALFTASLVRND